MLHNSPSLVNSTQILTGSAQILVGLMTRLGNFFHEPVLVSALQHEAN